MWCVMVAEAVVVIRTGPGVEFQQGQVEMYRGPGNTVPVVVLELYNLLTLCQLHGLLACLPAEPGQHGFGRA